MSLAKIRDRLRSHPGLFIFLGAFAVVLLFALCTNHVWEDYYITYRSSKNLANGHGLVFNVGERLHTFTSPLGVLLPALSHLPRATRAAPGRSGFSGSCVRRPSGERRYFCSGWRGASTAIGSSADCSPRG